MTRTWRNRWTEMLSMSLAAFALTLAALIANPAEAAMRPDVRNGIIAAQKLTQATPPDYAGALAKVKEVDAAITDKNPEEEYTITKFMGFVAINLQDMKTAQAAYNRAMRSGAVPDKEKAQVFNAALLLNFQNQDYAAAAEAGTELQKLGPLDDKSWIVFAQAYFFANKFPDAVRVAQAGVDQITAAGQKPSEELMNNLMNAQKEAGNNAGALVTQEKAIALYPTAQNWNRLVDRAIDASAATSVKDRTIQDHRILTLYRLRLRAGETGADDYTSMASLALSVGLPGEAKSVLAKGVAAGKITRSGAAGQLMARADKEVVADEKSLGSLAGIAKGQKNGEVDVKLGESYWSYGKMAEGEAAIQQGIDKGGLKDPGEALITLGVVQLAQGKKDAAAASFDKAAAIPANASAARAWSVFAKLGQGG